MAEPFISPLGLTMTPALSYSRSHQIRGGFSGRKMGENAYLEVEEDTISPAPGLALTDDDGGHGYKSVDG